MKKNSDLDRLKRIINYADAHFREEITIEQASQDLALSPSVLSHFFKKKTGSPFMRYLRLLRIQSAREMLRTTEMPLLDIALACGYNDNATFHRNFKQITGQTPAVYRESILDREEIHNPQGYSLFNPDRAYEKLLEYFTPE